MHPGRSSTFFGGQRRGNDAGVRAALGAHLAAVAAAQRAVRTGRAPLVRLADDAARGGERVPLQLPAHPVDLLGHRVHVQRGQRVGPAPGLGERVGRGLAGDAQLRLGLVVEGRQLLVGDGPVRHVGARNVAQRGAQPQVHRLEPVEVAAHVHRAAAHAVGSPRAVGALVAAARALAHQVWLLPRQRHEEVAAAVEDLVMHEVLRPVVRALLQHHHLEARPAQLQRHGRSARAAADDADVHRGLRHRWTPHSRRHLGPS